MNVQNFMVYRVQLFYRFKKGEGKFVINRFIGS